MVHRDGEDGHEEGQGLIEDNDANTPEYNLVQDHIQEVGYVRYYVASLTPSVSNNQKHSAQFWRRRHSEQGTCSREGLDDAGEALHVQCVGHEESGNGHDDEL